MTIEQKKFHFLVVVQHTIQKNPPPPTERPERRAQKQPKAPSIQERNASKVLGNPKKTPKRNTSPMENV